MVKYIAFLRAINVGGHTVKMDRLRELFESLGFADVETFIASGNVIFETKERNVASLEKKIAAHLEKSLGYEVDTFLRTVQEVAEIEQRSPLKVKRKGDDVLLYVAFMHETPGAAQKSALMALKNKSNEFAIPGREVYWLRLNRDNSIFLKTSIEKILGVPATMRNMTTINRIVKKYKEL